MQHNNHIILYKFSSTKNPSTGSLKIRNALDGFTLTYWGQLNIGVSFVQFNFLFEATNSRL